jgi:hypothetical protein
MGDVIALMRHRQSRKDPVVQWLVSMNIPVTRENYITHNWPGPDMPEEWTGEHEAELPEELQDWDPVE